MRRLLIALAALGSAAASVAGPGATVEAALAQGVVEARRGAGLPPLERRADLDRAARERARAIVGLPPRRRMTLARPIERDLLEAGVQAFHRATSHLGLRRGDPDPAAGLLESWRGYRPTWEAAVSPQADAIGLAVERAADGWFVFVAVIVEDAPPPPAAADLDALERRTFAAVNRERALHGTAPLAFDARLARLARDHSRDMARQGYVGHRSPSGLGPAERATAAGVDYRRLGENLHRSTGADDPVAAAMESWLTSSGHREAMLDPAYERSGVGVALDELGQLYFTQVFLKPR